MVISYFNKVNNHRVYTLYVKIMELLSSFIINIYFTIILDSFSKTL